MKMSNLLHLLAGLGLTAVLQAGAGLETMKIFHHYDNISTNESTTWRLLQDTPQSTMFSVSMSAAESRLATRFVLKTS